MSSYLDQVVDAVAAVVDLPREEILDAVQPPPDPDMGDYGFPCFQLAKTLRRSPAQIASELASQVQVQPPIREARGVGPYLNFFVDRPRFAAEVLGRVLSLQSQFGASDEGAGRNVVIDYSSPNIAKPFGIGHLRSTVIGNSLYKLFSFLGYRVVRVNHVGDWGTQFGKLITAVKHWGGGLDLATATVEDQYRLYVRFHKEAEADPSLEDEARAWHKRVEERDPEARALWQMFRDASLADFRRMYDLLGVDFDSWAGESFYEEMLDDAVRTTFETGVARQDQDVTLVDLSEYELPPCLLRKSDGATLYATRDLAALLYRYRTYQFHRVIYVVGTPQNLHFQQLFGMIRKMGYDWADRCVHVNFGHIRGMKSREGTLVLLEDVLGRSMQMVRDIIRDRQLDVDDVDEVAKQVGVGAIVFADLSRRRMRDYNFSWDEILNFDGETGPYVQYTHARLCSILRKWGQPVPAAYDPALLSTPEEAACVRTLERFPEVIRQAADEAEPHLVANYLIEVSTVANSFYQRHRVMDAGDDALVASRIVLVDALRQVLVNGLGLLGVAAPERM